VRSRIERRAVSALCRSSLICMALLFCPGSARASIENSDKVLCREGLSLTKREAVATKLRAITGWPEINFDRNGILQTGSREAGSGSQTARNLLNRARSGNTIILLEDASDRQDVVFAQVVSGQWKHHASQMPRSFVVRIDFADFNHLMGDRAALKAFDVGWAFLHELDHVVNDSEDPTSDLDAGECEDHLNVMRRECDLPLRAGYFYHYLPTTQSGDFITRFVRLAFEQKESDTKKIRRYWVVWDATLVGSLNSQAIARAGH
jgi:hypothetical protein